MILLALSLALAQGAAAVQVGLNAENLPELARHLPGLGIRSVRIMARWQTIEPYERADAAYREGFLAEHARDIAQAARRGVDIAPPLDRLDGQGFYWEKFDRRIAAAKAGGLEVLLTLRTASLWGTERKARMGASAGYVVSSLPKDMSRWTAFVKAVALRYKDSGVRLSYEVENEVNARAFWDGTPEQYARLLKATYRAAKEADPSARVLHAAMACGMTKDAHGTVRERGLAAHDGYLRAIFATKAFDALSAHDYYFPDREANGFTFKSYIRHIKGLAGEYGLAGLPLWISETGYVSRPTRVEARTDPGSQKNQALWLSGAVRQADAEGVERMFWMLIADRQEPYFGSMGLFEPDGTCRPVCAALRSANGVR